MHDPEPHSPVSLTVNVARLPQNGTRVDLVAEKAQRMELAREHELLEVTSFKIDATVTKWNRNGVKVTGLVEASILQECVVTLEPLGAKISEEFEQVYLPRTSKLGREGFDIGGEIVLDAEGPDSPETFTGDTIDVGALAEEFFALAIDLYPRKSGVAVQVSDEEPETADNPLRDQLMKLTGKA
jgi:hypothetical protein